MNGWEQTVITREKLSIWLMVSRVDIHMWISEARFPRAGRDVADPAAREKIKELVEKWIRI